MPKSTKRIVLSNEQVNSRGFRIITSGIDLSDFKKNPIMYYNHTYPDGGNPDQILAIGYWDDIQINGTVLSAVPVFDDKDPFAMKIYNKVEHGTIRAASVGINPVLTSDSPTDMLPGQLLPTWIKSVLKEASVCDIPSNGGAVALKLSAIGTNAAAKSINNSYSPEVTAILNNAVLVGKLSQSEATRLSNTVRDKETAEAMKLTVKRAKIATETMKCSYPQTLVDTAQQSWEEIERTFYGGTRLLGQVAPDLYEAKFFEKHGRMPACIPGK